MGATPMLMAAEWTEETTFAKCLYSVTVFSSSISKVAWVLLYCHQVAGSSPKFHPFSLLEWPTSLLNLIVCELERE